MTPDVHAHDPDVDPCHPRCPRWQRGHGLAGPDADGEAKWVDLFGIDPDYTGGMGIDEFLEQGRGEA